MMPEPSFIDLIFALVLQKDTFTALFIGFWVGILVHYFFIKNRIDSVNSTNASLKDQLADTKIETNQLRQDVTYYREKYEAQAERIKELSTNIIRCVICGSSVRRERPYDREKDGETWHFNSETVLYCSNKECGHPVSFSGSDISDLSNMIAKKKR